MAATATWVLSTVMTSVVATVHPGGGMSSASNSQANNQGGFTSEAECMKAGLDWHEKIKAQYPGADIQFTCRVE